MERRSWAVEPWVQVSQSWNVLKTAVSERCPVVALGTSNVLVRVMADWPVATGLGFPALWIVIGVVIVKALAQR